MQEDSKTVFFISALSTVHTVLPYCVIPYIKGVTDAIKVFFDLKVNFQPTYCVTERSSNANIPRSLVPTDRSIAK